MSLLIANRRSLAHSGLMESPRDFAMLLSIVAVSLGICNGSTLKYVHAITAEWGLWVEFGWGDAKMPMQATTFDNCQWVGLARRPPDEEAEEVLQQQDQGHQSGWGTGAVWGPFKCASAATSSTFPFPHTKCSGNEAFSKCKTWRKM